MKVMQTDERKQRKARRMVTRAIEEGKLTRKPCEECGKKPAVAHHEDYDKPLEVIWLCRYHHSQRHRGPRPEEAPPRTLAYSPKSVAQMLEVQPRTVVRWIREGKVDAIKMGRVWRIPRSEVTRILNG